MPPKFRAIVRKNLVPLTEKSGGAGILSSPGRVLFCPSCSTCRKRTLSTATSTPSYRTRSAGFRGATIQYSNRDLSGIGISHSSSNNCTIVRLRRYLSSAVSSDGTAVNNSNNKRNNTIPSHLRELYAALADLQDVAADHVSLSRLQLAQRGLETEEPVIRVAVLGVNDVRATRRLVRLLLADPLTEKQPWEDLIDSYGTEESNGLIIRYGQDTGIVENSLCPTISVTSPVLKNGRLEIFVSTLGAGIEPASVPITEEAFFVPTITVPTSESGGQHEVIRYPVHKSIICGAGTDGLLAYSSLLGRANLNLSEQLVHGAIELNVDGAKTKDMEDNKALTFVNADKAEAALAKFRESVHFASEYERGWTGSGVQSVSDWLSLTSAKTGLSSDLQALVQSLLETAEAGVTTEEAARIKQLELTSASAETRQSLDQSVSVWAERAHTELRNALDEGFASRRWKALSWWKLFWRVDDVGSVMAEILQTRYLPRAEKEMIWTAGRVKQTGLLDGAPNAEDLAEEMQTKEEGKQEEEEGRHPWPLQIATSRLQMLSSTIPSLQALSQSLVLFSASTTGLTSALSALLYTSASTGLYEACTIAAVGLIYSMRRQQVKWENARFSWETEVRERGRTALLETEELLRTLIRDGPAVGKEESAETRARIIIARARKALEDAKKK